MIIPGFLIAIATFPGVIVHEAAHFWMCRLRRIAVLDVCYFRIGDPCGYVIHEQTDDFTSSFLIATGPFFVNSLLCILICFPVVAPMRLFRSTEPWTYVILYLGISIGMHAFPSTADAKGLWNSCRLATSRGNIWAMISYPLVVLIFVANVLSIVWFDYLYGLAIGLWLPDALMTKLIE